MIVLNNVGFTYAGSSEPALFDVSFTLQKGEWVWLCGPSGSGKSTLIQGFHPESRPAGEARGRVYWQGAPLEAISEKRRLENIAILSTRDMLLPIFATVRETLSLVMENLGWPIHRMQSRLAEVCRYFALEPLLDHSLETLSGGQQQMVHLASVLMTDPKLLILDEPLSMLDPVVQDQGLRLLKKIQQEKNLTVLLSGHEAELMIWCDRVIQLDKGAVVFSGERQEAAHYFFKHPEFRPLLPDITALALSRDPEIKDLPFQVQEGRALIKHPHKVLPVPIRQLEKEPILCADHVVFAYEDNQPLLRDVSLEVKTGERLYLFGGNGSGKSTLLRLLAELIKPWEGKVHRPIAPLPYLSQFPQAYYTELSVQKILDSVYAGLTDADLSLSRDLADRLDLQKVGHKHPLDMSHGEQQRLALFIILSQPAPIYLLDEPTNGLDSKGRDQLISILKETDLANRTFIFCGHDLSFASKIADRACFLFDGCLTKPRPMHEFVASNAFYTTPIHRLFAETAPEVAYRDQIVWSRL